MKYILVVNTQSEINCTVNTSVVLIFVIVIGLVYSDPLRVKLLPLKSNSKGLNLISAALVYAPAQLVPIITMVEKSGFKIDLFDLN